MDGRNISVNNQVASINFKQMLIPLFNHHAPMELSAQYSLFRFERHIINFQTELPVSDRRIRIFFFLSEVVKLSIKLEFRRNQTNLKKITFRNDLIVRF